MINLLSFSLIAISISMTLFVVVFAFLVVRARKEQKQRDRGMFFFHDGKSRRAVDPISVMMAFEAHAEYNSEIHPRLVQAGNQNAILITLDAIKKAFAVVEFTEQGKPGLTVNEMLELWMAFYLWADAQKKNIEFSPTSVVSTEPTSAESSEKITNSTSDFGSIETAESPNNP